MELSEAEWPYLSSQLAAKEEELPLRKLQLEKPGRLKQLQLQEMKRVTMLDKMKQLDTTYKAAEHERNIVCQSVFSSQDFAKEDTSIVRPNTVLKVEKLNSGQEGHTEQMNPETLEGQAFLDQTNQAEHERNIVCQSVFSSQDFAKEDTSIVRPNTVLKVEKLNSGQEGHTEQMNPETLEGQAFLDQTNQVTKDKYVGDDLAGGVWKISRTRDDNFVVVQLRILFDPPFLLM
ncbi:uncharacterized protein LOC123528189 isoform X4 [Mercenaria mercenaria]|uniref:uncharacterized protein LOC123528189 isoform X4 n=1 Tax=Mercenaria mercenaria TaxID=6596 RepID=UPI00234F1EDA|nr:uncharacterized protein LOC123528189 isoform X4 [Mercenaria mercenaria]XP_053400176.1 uncharacterized protein LOC123528189 isoform X4 [Mercenaria mercenaria]XP_053400177.1 uncharacterized protein LOC123528189 isoform X4 [Mercenaria mercenaria]